MAVLLGLSSMSPERALSCRLCLASMAASARTAPIASSVMTPSATSPAGYSGTAAWCRIADELHARTLIQARAYSSQGFVTGVKAQCSACACSAAVESPQDDWQLAKYWSAWRHSQLPARAQQVQCLLSRAG